jgi:tripartite-type tricarboxylate transporter receptor subunit TctC
MPHDPETDFAYATMIWENCNVFMVSPLHPAKTLQELIAWSRTQPKGASIGASAIGSSPYLASVLFKARTGISATIVPFSGGAQSLMALMAGDTDFAIDNIASSLTLIRAGKVRALAVTSKDRWPTLPDVPTTVESGIKDFILTFWGALVMPKGTPAAIVNKISAAVHKMALDADLQQKFMDKGAKLIVSMLAQTQAFGACERVKWKKAVQVSGAKLD